MSYVRGGTHERRLCMAINGRAIAVRQRIDEQIPTSAVRATLELHSCHDEEFLHTVWESECVFVLCCMCWLAQQQMQLLSS